MDNTAYLKQDLSEPINDGHCDLIHVLPCDATVCVGLTPLVQMKCDFEAGNYGDQHGSQSLTVESFHEQRRYRSVIHARLDVVHTSG